MMKLNSKEIEDLMKLIRITRDDEINCSQCLPLVAEFAEKELKGGSIPESLKAVEHHMAVCSDCSKEYEMLMKALKEMGE